MNEASLGSSHFSATASTETMRTRRGVARCCSETPWTSARMRCDLKRDLNLALIFISHDLSVVKHISDRIMVFYLGLVMEYAATRDLVHAPRHPYTRVLISAAPIPDLEVERRRRATALKGDLPSPLAPPSGCVFRTRCPVARPSCTDERPAMRDYGNQHFVACPFGEHTQ